MVANLDQFNCNKCPHNRHCDERNPSPYPRWKILYQGKTFLESKVCLLPMAEEWCAEFFKLYNHYKNGVFPTSNGFLEQSNFYVDAMEFIGTMEYEQKES